MKKTLFFILIVASINSFASEFAPIGATWYYNMQEQVTFDAHGYTKYNVIKDTTINSIILKKIHKQSIEYNGNVKYDGYFYIYVNENKVYHYNTINDDIKLFFDFNLSEGDTLNVEIEKGTMCDSVTPIIIDSIGSTIVDSKELKVQYLSYSQRFNFENSNFEKVSYKITEKIGSISSFSGSMMCSYESSPVSSALRCYSENNLHYETDWWKSSYPQADCNKLINNVSIYQNGSSNNVKVYPNPTCGILHLDIANNNQKEIFIRIYNPYGNLVLSTKNTTRIDLCSIPKGVYFVYINYNDKSEVFKIIKE